MTAGALAADAAAVLIPAVVVLCVIALFWCCLFVAGRAAGWAPDDLDVDELAPIDDERYRAVRRIIAIRQQATREMMRVADEDTIDGSAREVDR